MPATIALRCTLVQELATAQRAYFTIEDDGKDRLASRGNLGLTVTNVQAPIDFVKGQRYIATLEPVE